ncbi:cytochrome P450 [Angustibacter sp. McL0619]|uniref:cytochrome P450 n=1 Tax=Angustibacter sp. McL0619 TaxID=3415676 RepID=UPI003CF0ECB5
MTSLSAPVSRWLGRRVLKKAVAGDLDLSRVPFAPESFLLPFRRDGVDPVPALGRRRERDRVSRLLRFGGFNVWLVTGHTEVRAVLADRTSYSNDIRRLVPSHGTTAAHSVGGLGLTDPPDHTRLRALLTPEFTLRRLARLQPRITQIVDDQLDVLEAKGPVVDLVPDFAFPIPFLVICELLGVEPEDREAFRHLGATRFDLTGGGIGLFGAASTSRAFLLDVVARQRAEPGTGLIGAILREHGDEIDDLDLAGLADGVFLGGYETTASLLSLGALTLIQHPEAIQLIREDDDAVVAVVEELLRYLSVVQTGFPRFARHDLQLFDKRITAGDALICSLSGANRDARFAAEPDDFDPRRRADSHLAFGHGFHRCVGAELARMELRTAFRAIARRLPDLALAVDPDELKFRQQSVVFGVDSLPVRLRPA